MASESTQIEENEEAAMAVSEAEAKAAEVAVETGVLGDQVDDEDESLEQQLEKTQETVKDYWDQIMRLKAEMVNNRNRADRDIENAHKYALRNFIEALLPVIDSLEMGQVAAEAENATLESIRQGTDMTMNMFVQVMEKHGHKQANPLGEKFDPEQHQAISMMEDANAESNSVIQVMQKGFSLNERLDRPTMVVVAK